MSTFSNRFLYWGNSVLKVLGRYMKIYNRQNKKIVASIFMIIIVMATTVVSFIYIYINTMKSCWSTLVEAGYMAETRISSTLEGYDMLLSDISDIVSTFDLKGEEVENIIKNKRIGNPSFQVRMILKDGYGVTENGSSNNLFEIYNYEEFNYLYTNNKKVTVIHEDKIDEGHIVADQIVPIMQHGDVQGFVIATIDIKELEDYVIENSAKGRTFISILDRRDGCIFIDTDLKKRYSIDSLRDSMIIKGFSFEEWKRGILNETNSRAAVYDSELEKTIYMYSIPVDKTDWTATVKLDEEIAFANLYLIRTVFYTLSLCEIIAFSLYILWNFKETKKQIEAENREYSEIAKALSGSYEMIYYVDTIDDTYSEINKSGDSNNIGIFCSGKHFFDESVDNIKRVAYKEDIDMLVNFIKKDNIMSELKVGEFVSREYRLMVNGIPVYYRMKAVKSNEDSNHIIIAVENIDSDIRADKEKQKALEEAVQAANSASRAKTVFLNNMSHDIRTPMNAIIGFTELASTHINNTEQVKSYLDKINRSSEHLLSLINDVLDMSRIESGKVTITEKAESIAEIVHALHGIIQSDIATKKIDFHIECCDVENENIICDKLRLKQALLNILSNAIKYTPEGGRVSFSITEKNASDDEHAFFEFKIKDNGMGMNEEFLKKIYDPFTREKSSTVSGIQGTGLGMAITRNIVKLMNGDIEINSEEKVGTEVILTFEFRKNKNVKLSDADLVEMSNINSVVIDSCESSCECISGLLKRMNINVVQYSKELDETEIKSVFENKCYDLIFVDWNPQIKSRINYISKIKDIANKDAKLIILSAYDWSDIEENIINIDGVRVLSKPLFKSDVLDILKQKEENNSLGRDLEVSCPIIGKHILLVEDNELNREIALDILHDSGFIVDTAEDGTIAVEKMSKANKGAYDLILMDIQMPIMDGYEATKRIRALPNRDVAKIPIIAMTANAFEEDKKLAKDAGMNAHLAKPIDMKVFMKTIRDFM